MYRIAKELPADLRAISIRTGECAMSALALMLLWKNMGVVEEIGGEFHLTDAAKDSLAKYEARRRPLP